MDLQLILLEMTPRMLQSGPMDIGAVGNWGTCGGG